MSVAVNRSRAHGGRIVALAALGLFATMLIIAQFPVPTQRTLLAETGPFETLSVVGYGLCIVLMFALWGARETLRRWYFATMLALFAGRELDLDKTPFTEGLLKSRQYIGETVPTLERAISALVLIAVIGTVMTLLRRETRLFLRRLRNGSPAAFAVLIGLLFIGVYKAIDGLARKLEPFGITVSDDLNQLISVVEEVGELGIPVMFAVAIILTVVPRKGG